MMSYEYRVSYYTGEMVFMWNLRWWGNFGHYYFSYWFILVLKYMLVYPKFIISTLDWTVSNWILTQYLERHSLHWNTPLFLCWHVACLPCGYWSQRYQEELSGSSVLHKSWTDGRRRSVGKSLCGFNKSMKMVACGAREKFIGEPRGALFVPKSFTFKMSAGGIRLSH